MKNIRSSLLIMLLAVTSIASAQKNEITTLRQEIIEDTKNNVLPFWINHDVDPNGGFYGGLTYDGKPIENASKGCVLNARILWAFSSGYRLFGDKKYLELANRAQRYFIDHFIDKKYGGTYWELKADGEPLDSTKQTYGLAYSIYGLSEHYRATNNIESLNKAIEIYKTLETIVRDSANDGYIEAFTCNWSKIIQKGPKAACKTMNTHIHLLEAYTSLYRVWKDDSLKSRLADLIQLVSEKLYNSNTHHLILYCDTNWKCMGDFDSYGHDIETSWLLCEAAGVLGDKAVIEKINKVAVDMVETALKEGYTPDGGMIYERYGKMYNKELSWWCQAETILGCINAWQITGDKKYLDSAIKTWAFIKNKMIDRVYGEWYSNVDKNGEARTKEPKASIWRCPYHNSRLGYELYSRFN